MDTNSTKTNGLTTTGNNQLPISVNVAKGLKDVSTDIEREQSRLVDYMYEINSKQTTISIERTWFLGGVSKESVETALEDVFKEAIKGTKTCVKAIQSTNKNMSYTLELIKLLALVEKDLYEQIDNQSLTSNEIKEFLVDWCKKQGINENEVRELFECSFQRAYTLRDRINELRNALKEQVREIYTRIESVESNYNSLIGNIEKEFKSQTENLNNLYTEKTTEIAQLAENIKGDISSISKTEKKLLNEQYEKFENLETTATSKLAGLISDVDDKTEILKKMLNTFQIQWEDDYKKITALYHKKNIWTVVSSVCASGFISTLLFLLLK